MGKKTLENSIKKASTRERGQAKVTQPDVFVSDRRRERAREEKRAIRRSRWRGALDSDGLVKIGGH